MKSRVVGSCQSYIGSSSIPKASSPVSLNFLKKFFVVYMIFLGKLKVEEEVTEGSWFGLSPKCYYLGNDAQKKIGTKGVPKSCALTRQEFEEALYDSETVVKRNFSRFQIDKKLGGVALINVTKKSLNAAYSKLYVSDNLVECTPWDSLNK